MSNGIIEGINTIVEDPGFVTQESLDSRGLVPVQGEKITRALGEICNRDWMSDHRLRGYGERGPLYANWAVESLVSSQESKKTVIDVMKKVFANEAMNARLSLGKEQSKSIERDEELEPGSYFEQQTMAWEVEVARAESDPEYAYSWYEQAREEILSAKSEVYAEAAVIDVELERLFGKYKYPGEDFIDIADRVVVVSDSEYHVVIESLYGKGSDLAFFSSGMTTDPEVDMPRACAVKLSSAATLVDPENPAAGMKLDVQTDTAKRLLRHEALHLVTDQSETHHEVDTIHGKRIVDTRGFRRWHLTEAGNVDISASVKGFPLRAVDEGAVTFLEFYQANNGDIDRVLEVLGGGAVVLGTSPGYREAGYRTARAVKDLGIEMLMYSYIRSDLDMWTNAMSSFYEDSYFEDMTRAQAMIGKN